MTHPYQKADARRNRFMHRCFLAVLTLAGLACAVAPTVAQEKAVAQEKPKAKKPGAKSAPDQQVEDITLITKDRVVLRCTYYHGPPSKETVPLILVHDWDGQRGDLKILAEYLQRMQYAVIVPDLRGHGHSIQVEGSQENLDREKFQRRVIESMLLDIEAAKSFLLKENNEGKLNIEQLGVIGAGFGASLALNWAVGDWHVQNLPTYKMGQDVKALVLVSPLRTFKGTTINMALKDLRVLANLSALIIVGGENSSAVKDAERVHDAFQRAWGKEHPEALPFFVANTSLQSNELITTPGTGVDQWIAPFLDKRLKQQGSHLPWTDRTSPLK